MSDEQLNAIPIGCNNNIAWNFGHIVISQQALCYLRAGLNPAVSDELIPKYIRGSKPEGDISRDEIQELINLSDNLIDIFEQDYKAGKFANFESYTTFYGITLASIEEAFAYSATHDFQHFGMAMIYRKLV